MKRVALLLPLLMALFVTACTRAEETRPATVEPTPSPERATEMPTSTVTEPPPSPSPTVEDTPLPDPTETRSEPSPPDMLFESPEYGIQTFLWWWLDEGDLAKTQDLGFGWVKQSFAWRDIERRGGPGHIGSRTNPGNQEESSA